MIFAVLFVLFARQEKEKYRAILPSFALIFFFGGRIPPSLLFISYAAYFLFAFSFGACAMRRRKPLMKEKMSEWGRDRELIFYLFLLLSFFVFFFLLARPRFPSSAKEDEKEERNKIEKM